MSRAAICRVCHRRYREWLDAAIWDGLSWTGHCAPVTQGVPHDFRSRIGPALLGALIGYFAIGLTVGFVATFFWPSEYALGGSGLLGVAIGGAIGYSRAERKQRRESPVVEEHRAARELKATENDDGPAPGERGADAQEGP